MYQIAPPFTDSSRGFSPCEAEHAIKAQDLITLYLHSYFPRFSAAGRVPQNERERPSSPSSPPSSVAPIRSHKTMEFPDAIYHTWAEYNRATDSKLYDLNDLGASRNCFSRALQLNEQASKKNVLE